MTHRDILDIAASPSGTGGASPAGQPLPSGRDGEPHWNDVDVVAAPFCAADWRALTEEAKRSYRLAALEAIRALDARRTASSETEDSRRTRQPGGHGLPAGPDGVSRAKPVQAARAALIATAVSLAASAVLFPAGAALVRSRPEFLDLAWLPRLGRHATAQPERRQAQAAADAAEAQAAAQLSAY